MIIFTMIKPGVVKDYVISTDFARFDGLTSVE